MGPPFNPRPAAGRCCGGKVPGADGTWSTRTSGFSNPHDNARRHHGTRTPPSSGAVRGEYHDHEVPLANQEQDHFCGSRFKRRSRWRIFLTNDQSNEVVLKLLPRSPRLRSRRFQPHQQLHTSALPGDELIDSPIMSAVVTLMKPVPLVVILFMVSGGTPTRLVKAMSKCSCSPRVPSWAAASGSSCAGPGEHLRLTSSGGHGSTNTKIQRWTTANTWPSAQIAFTYADSATRGMSITIQLAVKELVAPNERECHSTTGRDSL